MNNEISDDCCHTKQEKFIHKLEQENKRLRTVLRKLACLGNGDHPGNSVGNCIAQKALEQL